MLQEPVLEDKLQDLATHVGPLYQQMAPDAYHNQVYYHTQLSNIGFSSGNVDFQPSGIHVHYTISLQLQIFI